VLLDYGRAGVARVHVVDLDAALGEPPQRELIARMARAGGPAIQLGGGLRDAAAIDWALGIGCDRAVVGSLVAREPDTFRRLAEQRPGRLVPALDMSKGKVRIDGWTEEVGWAFYELAKPMIGLPCPAVLVTDVERDGMMLGPNIELALRTAKATQIPALLSGGISSLADLEAVKHFPEIAGAVVGRALYEGAFSLEEALLACR
jgi:phosphoribosylformimino-5-aminoimidazole carboxamide ribotide isomerase